MKREEALEALLKIVEDDRQARCEALQQRARIEVKSILRAAHHDARARVRAALEETRKRQRERVSRAEAQARSRERLAGQRHLRAMLEMGRHRVGEQLVAIWRDPQGRDHWIGRSIARAAAALPTRAWDIAHGADWSEAAQARLAESLRERGISEWRAQVDESIAAGVRVARGNNVLDFTVDGLLEDRAAIEARLLFHLDEDPP